MVYRASANTMGILPGGLAQLAPRMRGRMPGAG